MSKFVPFLDFALKNGWIARNYLREERIKLPKAARRAEIPTRADIELVVRRVWTRGRNEKRSIFYCRQTTVMLCLFAGLRPGEVMGLQWENVDFAGGLVRVRHSFSPHDGLKGPKTDAGYRDVPMAPPVREAILNVLIYQNVRSEVLADQMMGQSRNARVSRIRCRLGNAKLRKGDLDRMVAERSGPVIRGTIGSTRDVAAIDVAWKWLMRDIGLVDPDTGKIKFTLHALRHAFVSMMIEAQLPSLQLKRVIGHASVSTTFDVYGHVFPEDERTGILVNAAAAIVDATRERQEPIDL